MGQTVSSAKWSKQPVSINEVPVESPAIWLYDAFDDYRRNLVASTLYGVIFFVIFQLMLSYLAAEPFYLLALVSGFFLVGPFLALGIYDLSLTNEQGSPASFWHSAMAWRRNLFSILMFGAVLGVLMLAWVALSTLIATHYFNLNLTMDTLVSEVLNAEYALEFLAVYLISGAILAVTVYVLGVISLPMLLDKPVGCVNAINASIHSVMKNKLVMAIWAVFIVSLVAVGFATYGVALIVLVPIIGHASWHAYRNLVQSSSGDDMS